MAEINLDGIPEEQIAEALKGATDEQVLEGFRAVGVKESLDRTFQTMQEHFLPEKAEGVAAEVQWVVTDQSEEFPYLASIADGKCTITSGKGASPRVSLTRSTRAVLPGSNDARGTSAGSSRRPSRVGIGAPCGSVAGSPIASAIRSISSSDAACSSRSASSCTRSHE